jgi:hypothetical protein
MFHEGTLHCSKRSGKPRSRKIVSFVGAKSPRVTESRINKKRSNVVGILTMNKEAESVRTEVISGIVFGGIGLRVLVIVGVVMHTKRSDAKAAKGNLVE